jgi:hypothetical protein
MSFSIDPALVPLLGGENRDLRDPSTIANARGHSASTKTTGLRRKLKAKQAIKSPKHKAATHTDIEDFEKPSKCGCPTGTGNYSEDDITALLDCVEEELPLGQRGWRRLHTKFIKWACEHDCPERQLKSLGTKYKQVMDCFLTRLFS